MAEVAFVRVALFGIAAVNGTFSDNLTAVKEAARLFVVELLCAYLAQVSVFVQAADKLIRYVVMYKKEFVKREIPRPEFPGDLLIPSIENTFSSSASVKNSSFVSFGHQPVNAI